MKTYLGDVSALLDRAERFAVAQEQYAAQAAEDSQHWHHVGLANLLRELASALSASAPQSHKASEESHD